MSLTMFRFACSSICAQELTAATRIIQFKYDDGTTYLRWAVGNSVDPAMYAKFLSCWPFYFNSAVLTSD